MFMSIFVSLNKKAMKKFASIILFLLFAMHSFSQGDQNYVFKKDLFVKGNFVVKDTMIRMIYGSNELNVYIRNNDVNIVCLTCDSTNIYPPINSAALTATNAGTVTNIVVNPPLTGGVITTTGTVGADTTDGNSHLATQYDVSLKENLITVLAVSKGGTGLNTYTTGDIIYSPSTNTLGKLADVATGNVLLSGGVGSIPSYGKVGLTSHVSGILPVANGGLGVFNGGLTTGDLLYYNSSVTGFTKLNSVATGNVLLSGGIGSAPSWGKVNLTTHTTGTLQIGAGGTGLTSYSPGDILIGSGSPFSLTTVPDVVTGNVLRSGGVSVAPAWGKLDLTTDVTEVLPIAFGGTAASNEVDALNNLLPNQTDHAGEYLTTNGAGGVTWSPISGGGGGGLPYGEIIISISQESTNDPTWTILYNNTSYNVDRMRRDSEGKYLVIFDGNIFNDFELNPWSIESGNVIDLNNQMASLHTKVVDKDSFYVWTFNFKDGTLRDDELNRSVVIVKTY